MPFVHTSTLPNGALFSRKRADRAVRFIQGATVHTKSVWARKPFILEDWQRGRAWKDDSGLWRVDGIIEPLFGTVSYSEHWKRMVRQFQTAWIELARKNGKSELIAAIGLYLLIADGEWSAEIIGAASDKRQAGAVFNVARDMIRLSPVLSKMEKEKKLEIVDSRKRIIYHPTMSTYEVVSADAMANLGANPYAIIVDEVLAQPGRELWDYLRQGFGTRPNQILIGITTAGPDRESFAFSEHEISVQAATDPDVAPTRFAFVAFTEPEVDWTDESHWGEANPGLGTIIDIQQLRNERNEALQNGDLAAQANFRIFRLNQWGTNANSWIDMGVWDQSEEAAGVWSEEDIADVWAFGGLDLAETTDFISWQLVFPMEDRTIVKSRFWLTEHALKNKHRRRRDQLTNWVGQGHITLVPGDAYDYDQIRDSIMEDTEKYKIKMIGYDQFQAPAVVGHIESKTSIDMIKIPQNTTRMNSGSKELMRLLGLRQQTTNRNPVMRWMAGAATYKMDHDGNVKPNKETSKTPIDGISALVNAYVVKTNAPVPNPVTLHVIDACPVCDGDEIAEYGHIRRCRDCGYQWQEEDDDDDAG